MVHLRDALHRLEHLLCGLACQRLNGSKLDLPRDRHEEWHRIHEHNIRTKCDFLIPLMDLRWQRRVLDRSINFWGTPTGSLAFQ